MADRRSFRSPVSSLARAAPADRSARRAPKPAANRDVVVLGLGRFGTSLALTLNRLGHSVLGIDASMDRVQTLSDSLTHVVQADVTSDAALSQLGVFDIATAAVCIGSDLEASVLATTALADARVPNIWAKAISAQHGRILERVGAHHVVYPEVDMGKRVANLMTGRLLEFVELDDDFVIAELIAPSSLVGSNLDDTALWTHHRVRVVSVKVPDGRFTTALPQTVLGEQDLLVVAGDRVHVDEFVRLQ